MKIESGRGDPLRDPVPQAAALRQRRGRHRRARAGPGAHRRRRRRHLGRPAAPVHLRRDPDLGPLDRGRLLRPRDRRRILTRGRPRPPQPHGRGNPVAKAAFVDMAIWDAIVSDPRHVGHQLRVAGSTGCACPTWSGSPRPLRWSPRPSGMRDEGVRRHDVQGARSAAGRTAFDVDACAHARGARPRRRAVRRRQPRLDGERVGPGF